MKEKEKEKAVAEDSPILECFTSSNDFVLYRRGALSGNGFRTYEVRIMKLGSFEEAFSLAEKLNDVLKEHRRRWR